MPTKNSHQAPVAKKKPKVLTIHGDQRIDPYYWLNNRENQDVIAYLKAENDYTKEILAHTEAFQEELFQEIIGRIKQTDMSVPYLHRGYYYATKYLTGKEHPIYTRHPAGDPNSVQKLIDANQLAQGHSFYQVGGRSISPNNKLLVFGEDTVSRRIYTLRFRDIESGQFLDDQIENTTGSAVWASDNTVYYTKRDPALRPFKIFRHILGTPPSEDVEVYHEVDEAFRTHVYKTKSQQFIVIASFATLSTEFRLLDLTQPNTDFQLFTPRQPKHEHFITHFKDRFYIRTNWQAQNFRLMQTNVHDTAMTNWNEVVAHRPDVLLEDVEVFKDFLVLSERLQGSTTLRVMPFQGDPYYIAMPELASYIATDVNKEFDTSTLRFHYTSLKTPPCTYDFNMTTKEKVLRKQQEVMGDFAEDNYETERLFATARDGTSIPISLVRNKRHATSMHRPLLLYGYGSYGISIDPNFRSQRLSLLDRGFTFAIAHIRGGEEMGRHWYEQGKFLTKINTFTDFIDSAIHLQEHGYCRPNSTYAMGGSAGGLLMGAVINMAPQLFHGVIAAVPFVDVVTTMLDESIPLTVGEYDEWGNPNDPVYYHYMKSYSPYDNVGNQDYPAMLVTTGLHDSQVQYWEPAKWVAKLRDMKTDDNLLLLHCNLDTGHSGASGRFKRHRETALEYAFLLDLAGLANLKE